jgi:hypothetical protein
VADNGEVKLVKLVKLEFVSLPTNSTQYLQLPDIFYQIFLSLSAEASRE